MKAELQKIEEVKTSIYHFKTETGEYTVQDWPNGMVKLFDDYGFEVEAQEEEYRAIFKEYIKVIAEEL